MNAHSSFFRSSAAAGLFVLAAGFPFSTTAQVPPSAKTAAAIAAPAKAAELTAADVEAFLDGYMMPQLQRDDIGGAVVVIVKDGKVLFGRGYGYADVEKKKSVSVDDTLFRPGSVSKLFVWTAVMHSAGYSASVGRASLGFSLPGTRTYRGCTKRTQRV